MTALWTLPCGCKLRLRLFADLTAPQFQFSRPQMLYTNVCRLHPHIRVGAIVTARPIDLTEQGATLEFVRMTHPSVRQSHAFRG